MILDRPFEVITTATDGAALAVLAGADAWFTIAEVHALSGVRSRDQIRKVLARLSIVGITDEERVGNTLRYRLNRDHLASQAIVEIASLRSRLIHRLRDEFTEWDDVSYGALFGSAARNEMHADSDVDLFLVRREQPPSGESHTAEWDHRVQNLEDKVRRWTGNPTNVFTLTESELDGVGDTDAVANIRREGIPLCGTAPWIDNKASSRNRPTP